MKNENGASLISAWLEANGKQQIWLAKEAGITKSELSLILAGKRSISARVAALLAAVTEIDARALLGILPEGKDELSTTSRSDAA